MPGDDAHDAAVADDRPLDAGLLQDHGPRLGAALGPAAARRQAKAAAGTVQANSSFAVGEEAESNVAGVIRDVGKLAAPIGSGGVQIEPGTTARVDVVVRTRKIGHFFPGGTVDAFDTWLELQGKDAAGRTVFWSGAVTTARKAGE